MGREHDAKYLAAWAVLAGPFYLNDFASIYVADWRWWLAIDYLAVKLFPLAVVAWLIGSRRMAPGEFGLTSLPGAPFLAVFFLAALGGTLIDQNAYRLMGGMQGYAALGAMPEIRSSAWNRLDLSLDLMLVGAVEEIVFRGYACTVLRRYTESPSAIVAVSSVAFGLIHWSMGLHTVLVTVAIGAIFMALYLKARSAPPLILAHFAVDYIDYAGVVPKAIFRFF